MIIFFKVVFCLYPSLLVCTIVKLQNSKDYGTIKFAGFSVRIKMLSSKVEVL